MEKTKTRLLCTFTTKEEVYNTLRKVDEKCDLVNGRVYVLNNEDKPDEMLLTYNVYDFDESLENTMFVHRKKETNTLYSLNAMNEIIKDINGGVMDKTVRVPWENYKNMFLTLRGQEKRLHQIKTRLFLVVNLSQNVLYN